MTYTLFLACERGTAPYVAAELSLKKFPKASVQHDTVVLVPGCKAADLVRAAYTLQTPLRIGMLLGECALTLDTEESVLALETLIGGLDFTSILEAGKSFNVHCHREGLHEYNSVDMSQAAGRLIKRYAKESLPFTVEADLKQAHTLFFLHIDQEQGWLSLDLAGDCSKRPYKIFNNPHSMKGPTAATLLMAAGWTPKKLLIDPFSGGGEIIIEAALMSSGRSPQFYEKKLPCKQYALFVKTFLEVTGTLDGAVSSPDASLLHAYDAQVRNIAAAKKNSKIAGVEKNVTFSRVDVDWIDTKFSEKSVDLIVTRPVESSKHVREEVARDLHKKLFTVAEHVLKKQGSLTFLCTKPEELVISAGLYSFVLIEQKQFCTGKLGLWIARFGRK